MVLMGNRDKICATEFSQGLGNAVTKIFLNRLDNDSQ